MSELEKLNICLTDDYLQSSIFALLLGKTNSGKSHFLRYVMREISKSKYPFSYGVVFCGTEFENSYDFVPDKFIHSEYDEDVLVRLIELQKKNIQNEIYKRCFVIFDDCLSSDELRGSGVIRKLAVQSRHYGISVFICCQWPHLCDPPIRSNATHIYMFNLGNSKIALQSLYENFGMRFKSFDDFKQYYYNNIDNHQFIAIIKDNLCVLRAPENIPDFKLKFNKKYK